jgi:hypothetical protein
VAAAPAAGGPVAGGPVLGVSLGHPDTVTAEHWLATLSPAPVLACTHLVRTPRPHVALSLVFAGDPPDALGLVSAGDSPDAPDPVSAANSPDVPGLVSAGDPPGAPGARSPEAVAASPEPVAASPEAVAAHGVTGRAVLYPGVELLVGTLSVGEVLELSAIDRVEVLGGGDADPATLIDTGDFVRPQWRAGVLILTTTPAAGGRLVPFESRNPTPCCAAH